jgi:hypothetical protein
VKVSVALPAAAVEAAVKVTLCAVPGTRVSAAGFALTPAGNPLIATVTVPVKALAGTAFTLTACPAPPAVRAIVAGAAVREKSGGTALAEIVAATAAEWLRLPEVPVKVKVALPAGAVEAAVKVTFCAVPGTKVSAAGFAATPAGNPLIATVTAPVKPFDGTALTLTTCPAPPATTEIAEGAADSEKSGVAAFAETVAVTIAEWLRAPEVPVKVRVALPAAAVEAAVKVTFCAVPGIKVSIAGLAVTPAGNPLIATVTAPVKPFDGTALTLTTCPAPPATTEIAEGAADSEKSGIAAFAETVAATIAEWLRAPEVPVKVRVALPAEAVEAAVKVTFCAVPGTRVSAAGFAVTPAGSPLIATVTIPVKPFDGTAFTLTTCPAPPATTEIAEGVTDSEKSGVAAFAETVAVTIAEWLRLPEVPVKVRVAFPAEAVEAAVKVTFCAAPGVKVSIAGLAVTPPGNPLIATVTIPVKPFDGTAFKLTTCPAPPATTEIAEGVAEREKSGVAAFAETVAATVAE